MNKRQKNKYLKHYVPCAHEERYMAYYGDIATICKASKECNDCCIGYGCKRYKPKYSIKYVEL